MIQLRISGTPAKWNHILQSPGGSTYRESTVLLNFWSVGGRISTAESDLSRLARATLLLSLSVIDNFLEILQKFSIQETTLNNCFSSLQVTQIRLWWVCGFFFLLITIEFQLLKCLSPDKLSLNEGVGCQSQFPQFLSICFLYSNTL